MAEPTTHADVDAMLARAAGGEAAAWGTLLMEHQARLGRMVAFRMDPRLAGRVDAADVVQDAFLQAAAHREDYFKTPDLPLFLWLRGIVSNKLLEVHRFHLGTRMRDAAKEVPLNRPARGGGSPGAAVDATSAALLTQLTGGATGPGTAVARAETRARLAEALARMDPIDREVLALRHFEQLSNAEAAQVLEIQERAAAKRYLRALRRLKEMLSEMPGGLTGLAP
jgi:RNA polymerase sigma-70 factor (ECF subfamily)